MTKVRDGQDRRLVEGERMLTFCSGCTTPTRNLAKMLLRNLLHRRGGLIWRSQGLGFCAFAGEP